MKENFLMNCNKKKLIILVCILLGMILFFTKYAGLRVIPKTSSVRGYLTTVAEDQITDIIDLKQGDVYQQTLTGTRDEIAGFNIKFGTYEKEVQGYLRILFEDVTDKIVLYDETLDCETVKDNEYLLFKLKNTITDGFGKTYKITIEVLELEKNQKLAVFASNRDSYIEGSCFANDEQLKNLDIVVQLSGTSGYLFSWYKLAVIIIVVGFLFFFYWGFQKRCKIEYIYLIVGLFFGTVFIMCFPPYSAPDEPQHIASTYAYASQLLQEEPIYKEDGTVVYRDTDSEIGLSVEVSKERFDKVYEALKYSNYNFERNSGYGDLLDVPFWVYIPQILGVALGMLFNLTGFWTMYLGKIFAMLFFTGCTFLAIKIIPWGKQIIFVIALLPMTLELATSYSYDNVLIALCILLISYGMYLIYTKENVNWKDFIIAAMLICMIAPGKMFYFLIGGIFFLIPKRKFANAKQFWIVNCGMILLGIITFAIFKFQFLSDYVGTSGTQSVMDPTTVNYSISNILGNIPNSINVLFNTYLDRAEFYFNTMIGSSLGWFQVNISSIVISGFVVVLLGTSICSTKEEIIAYPIDKKFRYINLLFSFLMFMGILAALWIGWTPISYNYIEGVQGRYFLPFLPMVLFTFRNKTVILQKDVNRWLGLSTYVLLMFTFLSIVPYVIG